MSTKNSDAAIRMIPVADPVGDDVACWSYESTPQSWSALERLLDSHPSFSALSPNDFMWMAQAQLTTGKQIQLYKHVASRKYLCLDERADAYLKRHDGYVRCESVSAAVARSLR